MSAICGQYFQIFLQYLWDVILNFLPKLSCNFIYQHHINSRRDEGHYLRAGGLQTLCWTDFSSSMWYLLCDTRMWYLLCDTLTNCLTRRDELELPHLLSILPYFSPVQYTCGSWGFLQFLSLKSLLSLTWFMHQGYGEKTQKLSGTVPAWELQKSVISFHSNRAKEREQKKVWLTVPEYTGDVNQKRSCVTMAGEFINLWFTALQGPFGMQKEGMMKGIVSHGEKARQNTQRC